MKILCFGDSLTEGYYDKGNKFHPYTLKLTELVKEKGNPEEKHDIINVGISGETIYIDMKARLLNTLAKYKNIDVLIIQGGTNDILQYTGLQTSIDLFQEFQDLLNIAISSCYVKSILILTTLEGFYTPTDEAVMSHDISDNVRKTFNEKIMENYSSIVKNDQSSCVTIKVCDIAKEFPLFSLKEKEQNVLWDDNIHPSVAGYDRLGEILFGHLEVFL